MSRFALLPQVAAAVLAGMASARPSFGHKAVVGDWPAVYPQSFGAVGDGVHNDTGAVRAAVAHCAGLGEGGCDLVFTNGTFLTGPFTVPGSNSRLFVDAGATVAALPIGPWQQAGWDDSALISTTADGLHNVTFAGAGTIDGNGAGWWNITHDDRNYRPGMMFLSGIVGLRIEDVTLLNSPNHNIMLNACSGVRVQRLTVHAPPLSPNTDGINFGGGSDSMISDSFISNGDDCVSIVTGGDPDAGGMYYGGNVVVRNVTCDNGHGISIGSIRHGTVTNVTVENCTFINSQNGARIKVQCTFVLVGLLRSRWWFCCCR
jgi:polygalacturonase